MTTAPRVQPSQKGWAKAIARIPSEFSRTPLSIISGQIPEGLRGTLYRNGPARLERGGEPVGHWFDGDGAILAVQFTDAGASGVYRFVQTEGYIEESAAGRFLYANYGMKEPGPIWNYWMRVFGDRAAIKNSANTSVLTLPEKLLALWEGGWPHALDLDTLETFGPDNLGALQGKETYTAHPQRDPQTGEIFSFGVSMGAKSQLNLYKSDRTGKIWQKAAIELDSVSVIHSFVLAGEYLIFFVPPLELNRLSMLLGLSSYSEALQWQPRRGTEIIVVDRETLQVISRHETEPFFQWHFGNSCVAPDGTAILDLVRFDDFAQTNHYLREVATGETHTPACGTLWKMRVEPQTARIVEMEQAIARPGEFPVVRPDRVGQSWRYTYLALYRREADISRELLQQLARYDYETNTLTEADLGENRYVSEPIYAADAIDPGLGWILSVVYDSDADRSEVWIYDSDRLDDEPVCRLELPQVIPFSFHGTWRAAKR